MVRGLESLEANKHLHSQRSPEFKALKMASENGFPNCKGLYPDCPDKPDKKNKMCRTCPVLDE